MYIRTDEIDSIQSKARKGLNKFFYELVNQNNDFEDLVVLTNSKLEREIEEFKEAGYKEVSIKELEFHKAETEQEKEGVKKLRKFWIKKIFLAVIGIPAIVTLVFGIICLLIHALIIFISIGPIVFGILAFCGIVLSIIFIGNPFKEVEIQKTLIINPCIAWIEKGRKKRFVYSANVYIQDKKLIVRGVPIGSGDGFWAKRNLILFIYRKKNKKGTALFG